MPSQQSHRPPAFGERTTLTNDNGRSGFARAGFATTNGHRSDAEGEESDFVVSADLVRSCKHMGNHQRRMCSATHGR